MAWHVIHQGVDAALGCSRNITLRGKHGLTEAFVFAVKRQAARKKPASGGLVDGAVAAGKRTGGLWR
ncbi:hypothetical protein SDC9_170666 [bioreactor metagenome]|uniref:Uncharacterized protein n=1 Tax=bioreactor metagenome TaxID=1076179 RepID=A0A645G8Q5_9ZZZZ